VLQSLSRRDFVEHLGALGAVWMIGRPVPPVAGQPHVLGPHQEPKLKFFDRVQAHEIEAAAARIIPSDDGPGAREAGVVFFIDGGLVTFATDQQAVFRDGLLALAAATQSHYPSASRFSALTAEQQDDVLRSIEKSPFFDALRAATIAGMFALPSYGGNRDFVGWRAIGLTMESAYAPPFGYYDRPEVRRQLLGESTE
jgi:gluconate 2-dehydrogenase gamma chain